MQAMLTRGSRHNVADFPHIFTRAGGGEGFGVTESYLMYQNKKYHRYGTGAQPGR